MPAALRSRPSIPARVRRATLAWAVVVLVSLGVPLGAATPQGAAAATTQPRAQDAEALAEFTKALDEYIAKAQALEQHDKWSWLVGGFS